MKKLFIASILFLILVLLCSCSGAGERVSDGFSSGDGAGTDTAETGGREVKEDVKLFSDGNFLYEIVLDGGDCNADDLNSVSEMIKELCGKAPEKGRISESSPDKLQIILGNAGRISEMKETVETLAVNEYGCIRKGNKILITGLTRVTLEKAMGLFKEILTSGRSEDGKEIILPGSELGVHSYDKWFGSYPGFKNGKFSMAYDMNNGYCAALYTKVSLSDAEEYIKELGGNGYREISSNTVGNCIFRTLDNGTGELRIEYTGNTEELTIISGYSGKNGVFEYKPEKKICENKLTLLPLDYTHRADDDANGECIVITLEDGSFVVIDGGYSHDLKNLKAYLQNNNKRKEKICIAAWILTHSHVDHYGCFERFCTDDFRNQVTVKNLIADPVSLSMCGQNDFFEKLPVYARTLKATFVKAFSGDVFDFGSMKFEVIYSQENYFPFSRTCENMNETSLVFRIHSNGKTILLLADIESAAGALNRIYGEEALKCDIMQVPHHGYHGGEPDQIDALFKAASPSIALWTTNKKTLDKRMSSEYFKQFPNIKPYKNLYRSIGADRNMTASGSRFILSLNLDLDQIIK